MRLSFCFLAAFLCNICSLSIGQITGKVTLQGDPPEMPQIKAMQSVAQCAALHKDPVYDDSVVVSDKNEMANVIVFLVPAQGQTLKGPQNTKPAMLDQKGCMYSPHVLVVQTGQPVMVKNSDGFLHNIHALSFNNPMFNIAQATAGEQPIPTPGHSFTAVETFQIKCDVHPWMKAIVRVFDHPYFAVTDESGKYTIDTKGLPDGTYTIQAWQEVYKDSKPQQIEVKGGKASKPVDFVFQAKSGKA